MRWVGRFILMLGLMLLPLWICTAASEAGASEARSHTALTQHSGAGAADAGSGSSAPADFPEDGTGAIEDDDDDPSSHEMMPPASALSVHAGGDRFAGVIRRAGASPPHVHIEAETPPPRH